MSWIEECPNCNQYLGVSLSRYFWNNIVGSAYTSEFEYECPNCHTMMKVTVKTEPTFTISKLKENQ